MAEQQTRPQRRELWEQRMGRCKHFTGIQHDRCAADVAYDDVRGPKEPGGLRGPIPCLREHAGEATCPLRVFPTEAEARAEAAETLEHVRKVGSLTALAPGQWHADGDRPLCADANAHRARMVMHLDGRDTFTNVYECVQCGGHFVATQRRTGADRRYWR